MSRPPDYMYRMSEALSEVMDDIGVNEKLVMERRGAHTMIEELHTLTGLIVAKPTSLFKFGSQSEGSTTLGLSSDTDILLRNCEMNVIQHMREWKSRSSASLMMIQNENITPGYCYLQEIRSDISFPATANDAELTENKATDSEGRILVEKYWISANTILSQHGSAITRQATPGKTEADYVPSFFCKSSPLQAAPWLQKLTESKWPSEEDKTFCRHAGCFMVSASSKLSDTPKYECRISTSLQERCLMFCLTMTQLRCYVLMKMILKTHIHPYVKDVLTSFMCKNVLLYCVYNSSHESSQEWHTGNLLSYLHLCLFMLKECVLQRNCPHLMIPGNNLLAGRMTDTQRGKLLDIIDNLMADKEELMYKIHIDDLGTRLMMKFNLLSSSLELPSATDIALQISGNIFSVITAEQSSCVLTFLMKMYNANLEVTQQNLSESLSDLKKYKTEGNLKQQTACDLLIPLVSSTLGSVMASISIDARTGISDQALTYLEGGKESDVLSGRLKLVSVLYCTGDIERADRELKISEQLYKTSIFQSLCGCLDNEVVIEHAIFFTPYDIHNVEACEFQVALCTRFLISEINCVPHELRYEILKSYIEEDRQKRILNDSMRMNYITVDSVQYSYFLQYKTYGLLQRRKEQIDALCNLEDGVALPPDRKHKETTLNLLGQCCEQENLQAEAFQFYIRSLQHCKRNNAARFLMCIQLLKLWKKYKV